MLKITAMKKILVLLFTLAMVMGCDDGDMTFKSFDFSDEDMQECGTDVVYVYKVNGTEALIIPLPASAFANIDQEQTLSISGIIYRNYTTDIGTAAIVCNGDAPSPSLTILDEWTGEGNITIQSTPRPDEDGVIVGFNHAITIQDVSFTKGDETLRITNNPFGTKQTDLGYTFDFEDTDEDVIPVEFCTDNNFVFKRDAAESLILNLPDTFYPSAVNANGANYDLASLTLDLEKPLSLTVYSGSISKEFVCDNFNIPSPVAVKIWLAETGTIKIITTVDPTNPAQRLQEIRFYNVEFINSTDNNGETFNTDDYATKIDTSVTPNQKYYLFGTYLTAAE